MGILLHKIVVTKLTTLYFVSNRELKLLKFSLLDHNESQIYTVIQLSINHIHDRIKLSKSEVVISPKIECLSHLLL